MNNKGFTLIELLAVIVILAIILAIAIPTVTNIINSATINAFSDDAKMVLSGVNYKMLNDRSFDPSTVNETTVNALLDLDNSNYGTLTVKEIDGVLHITIVGKNKWNNLTASGTITTVTVTDTVTSFSNGVNKPLLAAGMTPIKWNGSAWVDTTENDSGWYNYDTTNKQWANARTADGSMWVWIPRFIYNIPTANWHTSTAGTIGIQFTKGVDDNWNKASIGNIDVRDTASASNGTWTNHPAFTFGDDELTGIWVAKFEASGSNSDIDSKPNATALQSMPIGDMFTAARGIETNSRYGWGTTGKGIDTHLMKNTEWGAIAYLTQSSYGKNDEIWKNNSSTCTTGCAGNSVTESAYAGCENTYDTANGLQASTTGNIYGIYDISGGVYEYLAAYVDNGNSNLTTNGDNILDADNKYKDIYAVAIDSDSSNYNNAINKKGDAVYETSSAFTDSTSWYDDYSYMPYSNNPWFGRGGSYGSGIGSGAYNIGSGATGYAINIIGFRPVLLVGSNF